MIGVANGTLYNRSYHTRLFLSWLTEKSVTDIALVKPEHVIEYLKSTSAKYKKTTMACVSTNVRSFFHYLKMRGIGHPKLAISVPRMKVFRLKNVPTYLSETQEQKFLESFDRNLSSGKRNYAIAILLLRLGLRANEVSSLTIDDIEWKAGVIKICNNKCRRMDRLPLLPEVGEALADYLKNGRPKSESRQIFLKLKFGKTLPIKAGTVCTAINAGLTQFGIDLPKKGSHIMRRTIASRMIQNGASLKEIADILRHRDLDTTMVYTKINIPLLRQISMPWPVFANGGAK
jgi:site-specific recombinase XerD